MTITEIYEKLGSLLDEKKYEKVEKICVDLEQLGHNDPILYLTSLLAEAGVNSVGELKNSTLLLETCKSYTKVINAPLEEDIVAYVVSCNEKTKESLLGVGFKERYKINKGK